ncbi:hypothetical protein GGE48_003922 [Rhizobium leguminosarum]|nr:hypothetical protein [Rhizobium leguminosarum]
MAERYFPPLRAGLLSNPPPPAIPAERPGPFPTRPPGAEASRDPAAQIHIQADIRTTLVVFWTVEAPSSPVNPTSEPRTGSEHYTCRADCGSPCIIGNTENFFSATCAFDYFGLLAADRSEDLRCSSAQLEAFEAGLAAASLGSVTKDRKESGAAYLIEGENTWMRVVVAGDKKTERPAEYLGRDVSPQKTVE